MQSTGAGKIMLMDVIAGRKTGSNVAQSMKNFSRGARVVYIDSGGATTERSQRPQAQNGRVLLVLSSSISLIQDKSVH
ncbi:hypothetical protein P3T76_013564 [Phytophthora citrophthora]|uniref:Uncharacterized protein n=1 Tax=Phytophthora citrophthora TaxID=4793 RepID=A0AAD9G3B2_9STRA|nr:hypothetical protein P3T76_013564 [Phytophthora citrophthora]